MKRNCSKDPPWTWVSLVGISYAQFLLFGSITSFGILYVEMLDVYQEGPLTTSWIPSAHAVAIIITSPISGLITKYASIRWMVIGCSLGGTLALIGCAMAPNVAVLIILYGVMFGAFATFTFIAVNVSCNRYFQHNLALANGIALAGASMGGILLPFLYKFILEEYTLRGSFFILAGLWLNTCVVGALLRPFSEVQEVTHHTCNETDYIDMKAKDEIILGTRLRLKSEHSGNKMEVNEESQIPSIVTLAKEESDFDDSISENEEDISSKGKYEEPARKPGLPVNTSIPRSFCGMAHSYCGPLISCEYMTLLLFWFAQIFGTFGTILAIPPYANELRFNRSQIASLLTILSASCMVAKLILGCVGDIKFINKSLLISANFAIVTVVMFLVHLMTQFWHLALFSVTVGLFACSSGVYLGPFVIEAVGRDFVGPGIGFIGMTFGIANTVAPLVMGGLREATGTYKYQFTMAGISFVVGLFIFCVIGRRIKLPRFSRRIT